MESEWKMLASGGWQRCSRGGGGSFPLFFTVCSCGKVSGLVFGLTCSNHCLSSVLELPHQRCQVRAWRLLKRSGDLRFRHGNE
jgi:hypothetical protein